MDNRFSLVVVASNRARQLMNGRDAKVKSKNKQQVTALREIAEGYVKGRKRAEGADSVDFSMDPLQSPTTAKAVAKPPEQKPVRPKPPITPIL